MSCREKQILKKKSFPSLYRHFHKWIISVTLIELGLYCVFQETPQTDEICLCLPPGEYLDIRRATDLGMCYTFRRESVCVMCKFHAYTKKQALWQAPKYVVWWLWSKRPHTYQINTFTCLPIIKRLFIP